MSLLKKTWITALGILSTGCVADLEPKTEPSVPAEDERLVSMVTDFYKSVNENNNSRTESLEKLVVESVSRKYYTVSADTIAVPVENVTRVSNSDKIFDISTVNFHIGEKQGYAVLSEAESVNTIFFFTENGLLGDTAFIAPLKTIIDSAPNVAAVMSMNPGEGDKGPSNTEIIKPVDPDDGGGGGGTSGGGNPYQYGPLLKTEWDQESEPYNSLFPYCECSNCRGVKHMSTGCVAMAVAQTLAYLAAEYDMFNGVFYKTGLSLGNKINYLGLISNSSPNNEKQSSLASQLLLEVAIGCQTKFSHSSSSNLQAAYHYLNDIKDNIKEEIRFNVYLERKKSLDSRRFQKDLSKGFPHIMSGNDNNDKSIGHAWVVDGFKTDGRKTQHHVNWGLGSSNGWATDFYIYKTNGVVINTYGSYQNHIYFSL